MEGCDHVDDRLHTEMVYPPADDHHPSTVLTRLHTT